MTGQYAITGRRATEIASSVESLVASGRLRAGQPLPTVRALAADLGVNANTVASAYSLLRDRAVVETAGRRGTRVRPRGTTAPRWTQAVTVPAHGIDLSTGNPAIDLLPSLRPAFAAAPETPVRYGDTDLAEPLRRAARHRLGGSGIPTAELAVTSGALDGIERVLSAHLRPGDRIAVEDPGWGNLLDLIAALGLATEPVRVDDEGPDPDGVASALRRGAQALVVTSRAQNPTGAALTARRASALRRLLRTHPGTLLVEDDHAAEVAGVPVHPLCARTPPTSRWAHVRSLSKAYGPDLRVAVLAGDPLTVGRVRGRLRLGPGWVSHTLQHAAAWLWADPASGRVVHRAAERYAQRRGHLLAALAEHGITGHGRSGLNVWVPVPDETAAVTALLAAGWAVAPGSRFRLASGPGIRLTVAELPAAAVGRLAAAVAGALRPATGGGPAR